MEITAAVARQQGGDFTIERVMLDEPRADEIRVRIVGVGLCHTDLVFKDAGVIPAPVVLGHEGAGVVEAVGTAVTKVKAGDRVAISFRSCGECVRCKAGLPAYCLTMPMLNYIGMRPDGSKAISDANGPIGSNFFGQSSFATHALAYERNLVKVPDAMPLEIAGPLGCGIQTGAGGVMNSMACPAGSSLLVLGGGSVGLSAVLGAVVQGCNPIILVEPQEARRQLALDLGATHVIDPKGQTIAEAVRAILPNGVDYAFETTGLPAVMEDALGALAPHAVFGFVGVPGPEVKFPGTLSQAMTFGYTFKGIIEGDSDPDVFIPLLIDLWSQGRFPFDKLIQTYPLEKINEAVADQHHGKCVKVVLLTGQEA
ncbi:NAD(P)-dependent alcohol dehydrogenase [Zavarzinia sp. CC-PAN008]|uniref:NAD(P)-dependent alcohol dehydrogenase n=1 Tax=Zavarzinia sp. CC-PAN008 TaxID=3243332 RepID=UPI003F744AAF